LPIAGGYFLRVATSGFRVDLKCKSTLLMGKGPGTRKSLLPVPKFVTGGRFSPATFFYAELFPWCLSGSPRVADEVVGQAQAQQNQKPEQRRNDHGPRQPLAGVLHMHEEEHNQQSLAAGDEQGHDGIQWAEIYRGCPRGYAGENNQDQPDRPIKFARQYVL